MKKKLRLLTLVCAILTCSAIFSLFQKPDDVSALTIGTTTCSEDEEGDGIFTPTALRAAQYSLPAADFPTARHSTYREGGAITLDQALQIEGIRQKYFWFMDAQNDAERNEEVAATKALNCNDNASGWGWFVCRMVTESGSVMKNIYDFVDDFLMMDASKFSTRSSRVIYNTWNTFRTVANIGLIGMLVFVIISQITGIGISNYGIKKGLPRILVVVVLVNLSFMLGRGAVEVANISGQAVKTVIYGDGTTNGLTKQVESSIDMTELSKHALTKGQVAGTGVIAAITATIASRNVLTSGQAIIVMLMLAAISAVVGIVLLIVILVVRHSMVVLSIIAMPVIIILYLLPGTKSLFDKWKKMFTGMLLAYPISAMMLYGGALAAAIILSSLSANVGLNGDEVESSFTGRSISLIIALIAAVGPVFLIPSTIIKSTGAVGAAIQRLANRLTSSAQGALRNSTFAEKRNRAAKERANRIKAGVKRDGTRCKGPIAFLMRSKSKRGRQEAENAAASDRASRRADARAQETAAFEHLDDVHKQAANTHSDVSKDDYESRIDDIALSDRGDFDECAAELTGMLESLDKNAANKHGADEYVLRLLDNPNLDPRMREAIIRQMLNKRGDKMKSRSLAVYGGFKAAQNNPGRTVGTKPDGTPENDLGFWRDGVERAVDSDNFNAKAMTNLTKGDLGNMARYVAEYNRNSAAGTATAEQAEYCRKIQETLANAKASTDWAKNATPDDFKDLESALANFQPPTT